jgi:carbon monoxide dehydrogenase subunit G
MTVRSYQVKASISNTPAAVIGYVADVRNRPLYFPSLKSISDIKGEPSAVGTTWKWTFVTLGMQFQGVGRCLQHEPGRLYSFQTEGGIDSTFTYRAETEGQGTKLTIDVEYKVPEAKLGRLASDLMAEDMKKAEADRVIQNLKTILDK